ncbi:hypothetical protein K8354_09805 [Polaribacter litorisediminis]|uniref:hypothetical protein n=1 Tax=Polaribacter litorisediminis TaxID=1908341 RepID=UPI001CBAD68F|nr:hypothetical protein [Polaribacter litorisediminis]UAM96635.1 hypothetical protein K8354_09805 [Polaribacter litorisediminis]
MEPHTKLLSGTFLATTDSALMIKLLLILMSGSIVELAPILHKYLISTPSKINAIGESQKSSITT